MDYESLLNGLPGVVYVRRWDDERTIEWMSSGARRLLGRRPDAVLSFDELLLSSERAAVYDGLAAAVADSDEYELRYRVASASGEHLWIVDHGAVQRSTDGTILRCRGLLMDDSRRHRLQAELVQAQKMEAVARLAGGIAHDFNNVLTVVSVLSSMMRRRFAAGSKDAEDAQSIYSATERAKLLAQRLLAFSRRDTSVPAEIALDEEIVRIAELAAHLLPEDIRVDVVAGAPEACLWLDSSHLEQVLMNLVVNARDAMPAGGELQIRTAAGERGQTERVSIAVSDTGEGMPADVQSRIFEPFFTTKEVGRGTGLGLSTVRSIVDEAGGELRFESRPGAGTTFEVSLPRHRGSLGVPTESQRAPLPNSEPVPSARILVVDDDDDIRGIVARVLSELGHLVIEADAVSSALEAYDDRIELLMCDVVLRDGTALQLTEALRDRAPTLPIVYMSGHAQSVLTQRKLILDVDGFLAKPFTVTQLRERVDTVLRAQRGGARPRVTSGGERGSY